MTHWRGEMIKRLHQGVDPFAGFVPDGWADPTDEWDSHHAWFDEAVRELNPNVIIEVGSFLGASARHFAGLLRDAGSDGVVVCVDTWLGDAVLWDQPEWRDRLRHTHGRPEVYRAWMANALAAGLEQYLCPLPMDSRNAARYLAAHGVTADLVYIDGSHAAGDVRADLELYWERLRPGGILLADDYQPVVFPGVVADVNGFAADRGLAVESAGMKARLRKRTG